MAPSCAPPPFLHDFRKRKKSKPIKIFSGVGHGIRKPKPKQTPKTPIQTVKKTPVSINKPVSVRQSIREKFDFSRTPYALTPVVRRRVALNEESSKKRKFFKTTVEIEKPLPKKVQIDETSPIFEFDDITIVEEPEFEEINRGVDSILDEWNDDEINFQQQMTRQKADELQTETTHLSLSYITPSTKRSQDQHSPNTFDSNLVRKDTPPVNQSVDRNRNVSPQIPDERDEDSPENKFAKIFSAVLTPPAKSVLCDVTNKNSKTKASLFKAAAPVDQMQIDAGQKVIGPVECSQCGMVYDVGDPVDEKRHADYHAKRHELKYKVSKTDKVVGICGEDRIYLIKYSDEKKRDKVRQILKVTEEEIGFGYSWGPVSVAFVYVRNDRILGCLIAEPKVVANRVIQSDGIVLLSTESQIVKCGINRIWVKKEFRGNRIGTELINCLRKNYVYGDYLKVDDIAFSVTTPEGHAFARKYTGRKDYLTYEEPTVHQY